MTLMSFGSFETTHRSRDKMNKWMVVIALLGLMAVAGAQVRADEL